MTRTAFIRILELFMREIGFELPCIYTTAFEDDGEWIAQALAEDGTALASCRSKSLEDARREIGYLGEEPRNAEFLAHYPKGFTVVWVRDAETDFRWQIAMTLNLWKFERSVRAAAVG